MDRREFLKKAGVGLGAAASGQTLSSLTKAAEPKGWGDLKVRFVYDGEPPTPKPIKVTVDCNYCGVKEKLYEEKLVVNKKNNGLVWVAAWLYVRPHHKIPIHESFQATEKADVLLNSTNCRVDPHVQKMRTTQTLLVRNTDPIADGIKIDPFRNRPVNMMFDPGGEARLHFRVPERLPVHVACPVHPWESGWLLIHNHPYVGISDQDGTLVIEKLPAGEWKIQFWHESAGYLSKVKIDGKETVWPRGCLKINIKPGLNDLGTVHVSPKVFRV